MPQTRRPHRPKVSYTDEELALLRERARTIGRPLARYIRETSLGVVPKVPPGAGDAELIRQLLRIGNSLNQLAREANGAERFPEEARLERALDALNTVVARL